MRAPSLAGAAAAGATEIGVTGAGAGREAGGGAGTAAGLGASTFAAGAGAGAAAGAAAAAPAASIVATTVLIGTVWPSLTLISFSTPAEGEGISASTLSVEISKSGSSRSTLSPGFFSHLVIVPSKMLSPIWGITTSAAIAFSCDDSHETLDSFRSHQFSVIRKTQQTLRLNTEHCRPNTFFNISRALSPRVQPYPCSAKSILRASARTAPAYRAR